MAKERIMATVLETINDTKNETLARAFLESKYSCKCVDMPQFSPVDCIMVKPTKVAGVEFKFRNIDYMEYPDIWLEESKQVALMSCKAVWDKAYFMPSFNGVLYSIEVDKTLDCHRVMGGRNDRGIDDRDWMVSINMDMLSKVGKLW